MILNLKRCISLLLVAMLLIGMIPTAYATDTDSTVPEERISEGTEATEPTEKPTEPTYPTEPTEPTDPPKEDTGNMESPAISEAEDFALMSIGSTQNSIMLFDYADNGNYTTVLNSQVFAKFKYPKE